MVRSNQNLISMQSFRSAVGEQTVFHRTWIMMHPGIAVQAMHRATGSVAVWTRGALR